MKEIPRRQVLKAILSGAALAFVSSVGIPSWIEELKEPEFLELTEIMKEVLTEDEMLDLLDEQDLQPALGLCFTFLLEKGYDPEEYLITKKFLQ